MEPIGDHAIIGDGRSAALITRGGSIDWLCWPRFDSPSLFAALLDDRAGRFSISPPPPFRSSRSYVEGTNVLVTSFETPGGRLALTDLMPVASDAEKVRVPVADHEILRVLECMEGDAEVEVAFEPRPRYGLQPARLRDAGRLGIRVEIGASVLSLRSESPLAVRDGGAYARLRLRAGESCQFSLTFDDEWPAVLPPLGEWERTALARSIAWWRAWAAGLRYRGPAREAVLRSALALKLLVYAPSGAVVAAPTTSLPERLGGDLNWDYRYCWLRDASLTARALFGLGFDAEATAFVSWLLQSTRLTRPELRILYDVHGNRPRPERTLEHFAGYRGSRPVRVGNGAVGQLQLDVYGEVIDAATQSIRRGGTLDRETRRMLVGFGRYVCDNWRRPDEGIWEPRTGRRLNTHSRLLCWVALDRLIDLARAGHLPGTPIDHFAVVREEIRREIETRAWNEALGSYVARLDGDELDASLLLMTWYGFARPDSGRMQKTYARIAERLGAGDGLLYRYLGGPTPGEGAFGICSFWAVEYLALGGGTIEQAQRAFASLTRRANDLGLYAEEIEPSTGEPIGNFPQAFTHVGLVNAALSICRRLEAGNAPVAGPPAHAGAGGLGGSV